MAVKVGRGCCRGESYVCVFDSVSIVYDLLIEPLLTLTIFVKFCTVQHSTVLYGTEILSVEIKREDGVSFRTIRMLTGELT